MTSSRFYISSVDVPEAIVPTCRVTNTKRQELRVADDCKIGVESGLYILQGQRKHCVQAV